MKKLRLAFVVFFLTFSKYVFGTFILNVAEYNIDRNGAGMAVDTESGIYPQINMVKSSIGVPDLLFLIEVSKNCTGSNFIDGVRVYKESFNMTYDNYEVEYEIDYENMGCETGNAIISRYTMENIGVFKYENQCCDLGRRGRRNLIFSKIILGEQKNIYVIATHLEAGTSSSSGALEGVKIRYQQSRELLQYIRNHVNLEQDCLLIAGDFNIIDTGFLCMDVIPYFKKNGLRDAHADFQGEKTTIPSDPITKYMAQFSVSTKIDFILYGGKGCFMNESKIMNKAPYSGFSDHSLISATLYIDSN